MWLGEMKKEYLYAIIKENYWRERETFLQIIDMSRTKIYNHPSLSTNNNNNIIWPTKRNETHYQTVHNATCLWIKYKWEINGYRYVHMNIYLYIYYFYYS